MGPTKRRIALAAAGLAAVFVLAPPAVQATPKQDPVAHAACDAVPCPPVPDNLNTPPGGSATETLPVPAAASAAVTVTPAQPRPDPAEAEFFDKLHAALSAAPSTIARIHKCIDIAVAVVAPSGSKGTPIVEPENASLAVLFMLVCLDTVRSLENPTATATDAAAGGCHQAGFGVGVRVTRVGRKFRVQTTGSVAPAGGLPGLRVTCRRLKGSVGFQISMQPTKRRRKLNQVLGPTMAIGFANPSNRSVPVHTVVAFR